MLHTCYLILIFLYETWNFHGDEDLSRGLLDCDTV
jgi:hypothetical protein